MRKETAIRFPRSADIPKEVQQKPVALSDYLVGGVLRRWDGPLQEVHSPVCVETSSGLNRFYLGSFPLMTQEAALEVLAAATEAYGKGRGVWPNMSVVERIECLQTFSVRMKEVRDQVVRLLMWEVGKPLKESEKEFDRTVDYLMATINATKELHRSSSQFLVEDGLAGRIRRTPLGVVLCMGPFNYPLNETFTTLIPALIMGNTVVLKPPRHGVLLFKPLLEAFRDCFPPGVVNTVFGVGRATIPPLMATGQVDVLAFIGSSGAADQLQKAHPLPHRLRAVFGLDAKNPAIVLPDADLELAVRESVAGSLSFNGQRCTAIKIIFVHEAVAEPFLRRFASEMSTLRAGMPWDPWVNLTPLPEPGKPAYLSELLADAVSNGARVVNRGGGKVEMTFFHPALVYPVNEKMRLYHEEQFGPVIPVLAFDSPETPVEYMVSSNFGQQVSLFGRSPELLGRLVDQLANQVSRININSQCQRGPDVFPFTGRKDSAVGTLSVADALRAFSIRTLVAGRITDDNRDIFRRVLDERASRFLSTDFIM